MGAQAAYERGGAIVGFDGAEFSVDGHHYLSFAAGDTLLLYPPSDDEDGWAYGAVDADADGWAYELVGLWGWLPRCFFEAYSSERESPPPPWCNRVAKWIWDIEIAPRRCDAWPQWIREHGTPSSRAVALPSGHHFAGNVGLDPDGAGALPAAQGSVVCYYCPKGTASS